MIPYESLKIEMVTIQIILTKTEKNNKKKTTYLNRKNRVSSNHLQLKS